MISRWWIYRVSMIYSWPLPILHDLEGYQARISPSPLLEIQVLDSKRKDACKEDCEDNWHGHNRSEHVVLESERPLNKGIHGHGVGPICWVHECSNIPKLSDDETIECPRHRASPVVPYPPFWDALHTKNLGQFWIVVYTTYLFSF